MNDNRYNGQPFLRMVELYILHIIEELTTEDEQVLAELTPKLQQTFGGEKNWVAIVETQMGFSSDLPIQIRQMYEQNKANFSAQGQEIHPNEFAMFLADNLISQA